MNSEFYYNLIEENMCRIIRDELTIGCLDRGKMAYTEKEIAKFIEDNMTDINQAIHNMYLDYLDDDKLENLCMPVNDWFAEYLFDYVGFDYDDDVVV
jgi:hypothetical protein